MMCQKARRSMDRLQQPRGRLNGLSLSPPKKRDRLQIETLNYNVSPTRAWAVDIRATAAPTVVVPRCELCPMLMDPAWII